MRTPLSNVDAAWLRMDEPTNPMVVTGVLVLGRPVTLPRIRRLVRERLLRFPRFRQRVVGSVGLSWEDDPRFSLGRQVVLERLPADAGDAELQALIGVLATRPFPEGRPLWRIHVVPRYRGGSALVVRIHHCIADGVALVHVLLSMADVPPEGEIPRAPDPLAPSRWEMLWASVASARRLLPQGAEHLAALVRLLVLAPDPRTRFKGPLGMKKKLVWSHGFRLEDFKRVGRSTGSTVNDVLMAALAGALRRYLLERGAVKPGLDIRGGGRPLCDQGDRGGHQRDRSGEATVHSGCSAPAGDVLGSLRGTPRTRGESPQLCRTGLGGRPQRRGPGAGSGADRLRLRGGAGRVRGRERAA
jgi:diacylglycerol O-acyltransferase / wax synthase